MPEIMLDLIGAISLGAVSLVVVLAYLYFPRWRSGQRAAVAAGLLAWFALVMAVGATGVLDAASGIGPAGLGIAVMLPFALLSYLGMRPGSARDALAATPLPALIGVHAIRLLGVFFVLLFHDGRLPAPFAPAAGWGDILIGATALPVAYLAATRAPGRRYVTLAWSTLGLFDLANAIALGAASSPGMPFGLGTPSVNSGLMTTLPWILIPCFNVPLLAHLHVLVFRRLWRSPAAGEPGRTVPPAVA